MMKERNNPYTTRYEESTKSIHYQARDSLDESVKRRLIADNKEYERKQKRKGLLAVGAVALGLLVAGNMDKNSEEEAAKTTPPVELIKKNIAETQAGNDLRKWVESQKDDQ